MLGLRDAGSNGIGVLVARAVVFYAMRNAVHG
jgi:hypothetical protein